MWRFRGRKWKMIWLYGTSKISLKYLKFLNRKRPNKISNLGQQNEMAHPAKAFAWPPLSLLPESHEGGRRELTPQTCPLTATHAPWYICPHPHIILAHSQVTNSNLLTFKFIQNHTWQMSVLQLGEHWIEEMFMKIRFSLPRRGKLPKGRFPMWPWLSAHTASVTVVTPSKYTSLAPAAEKTETKEFEILIEEHQAWKMKQPN